MAQRRCRCGSRLNTDFRFTSCGTPHVLAQIAEQAAIERDRARIRTWINEGKV